MEQLAIPGAGGIIVKEINGVKHILTQIRVKPDAPCENGLMEIPAGKMCPSRFNRHQIHLKNILNL